MTTMPAVKVKRLTNSTSHSIISKRLITCLLLCISVVSVAKPAPKTQSNELPFLHYKSADQKTTQIKDINPHVLQLALKAHQKANKLGLANKSLMTIIDYSLPSTKRRMWVVDMSKQKVIYHTLVAHGSGSGDNHAKRFSDIPGSLQSSLGVFVTGKTYQGKHGLSLTLHGLEQGINGNAERRRIVVHGAHYVNEGTAKNLGRLGRSWGCPALDTRLASPIINTIKEGSLVFAYYPDDKWLKRSKFLS
ncbi:MAG: murein L,D-transpeptidase catalytic domain family protein [Proteobacteria bacterium]|nr:murein L,D-transpeptidase catalytic domain family protein [Pseudomonadota bacterium]